MILGAVLALALAGGGFFATYTDLLGLRGEEQAAAPATAVAPEAVNQFVYMPIDPITISLGSRGQSRHLRLQAQLEVAPLASTEVARLMPRILDVLNIYLRALETQEIEEPAALVRLRAQMLRRIQIVTGPDLVNDLLISEFVFL